MILLFPNTAVTSVLAMGFRVHPVLLYYVMTELIISDVESLPQSNLYSLQTLTEAAVPGWISFSSCRFIPINWSSVYLNI